MHHTRIIDVMACGATGDGSTLDTPAVNRAIETCASKGGGQVFFPPGHYLSGTVVLRSHVSLRLEAGARLMGAPDLSLYQSYSAPAGTPEAKSPEWHRALVLGVNVEDVSIVGEGVIDGQCVFDAHGEEHMRGPHAVLIGSSHDVSIRGISLSDAANYAILIEFSDQIEVRDVKICGGWDGVHFRGWLDRPCKGLSIIGCRFFTGDDAIAGRYADNLVVRNCEINSSCNGVRIIGPVSHAIFQDCLFQGPGIHPHRTQNRHNMLSGILLQPGAWGRSDGPLEDVLIADITMHNVASPVSLWVKSLGNTVQNIIISRLSAFGVYRAAASIESWTSEPIRNIEFRDVMIQYVGEERSEPSSILEPPHVDSRPLPAWGFYARNARNLSLEDVRLIRCGKESRPATMFENMVKPSQTNIQSTRCRR